MSKPASGGQSADSIDHFLRQWRAARPDLDPEAFGVFGRIHRLSGHLVRRTEQLLGELGLGWESFSLIVTLRRAGPPFALRPTDLLHESLLSSGAVTNRIDRVERLGLVRRAPDPNDRRGVIVKLTPAGRLLADRAIKRHFQAMDDMLSFFPSAERRTLARLLGKLLTSMEHSASVSKTAQRKPVRSRNTARRPKSSRASRPTARTSTGATA
ncbi:MAG TPA: MarR family transcriptional regulator [Pseudolabrys sp.]|nr:MarR family transcriptional regulator [Pseudolabrys sp.]